MHLFGHISSAIRARLKASSQLSESLGSRRQVLTMESVVLNTLNFELSTISILKFLARFLKAARLDQLVPGADHAKKVSEMKLFAEVRERFGLGSLPALVITVGSLQYVAELTLQDYKFIKVLPSKVAAAVVSLTLRVFRQADWVRLPLDAPLACASTHALWLQTPTLQHYTKYQLQDLQPCLALLAQTLQVVKCLKAAASSLFLSLVVQGSAPTAGQQPLQAVRDKYRSSKFGRVSALSLDALQPMPYL